MLIVLLSQASGKGPVAWFFLRGLLCGCHHTLAGAAASEGSAGLDIQAVTHVGAQRDVSTDLPPRGFSWKAVSGCSEFYFPHGKPPERSGWKMQGLLCPGFGNQRTSLLVQSQSLLRIRERRHRSPCSTGEDQRICRQDNVEFADTR